MGGPWPMNAAMHSRPLAVSLKVWLRETNNQVVTLIVVLSIDYSN